MDSEIKQGDFVIVGKVLIEYEVIEVCGDRAVLKNGVGRTQVRKLTELQPLPWPGWLYPNPGAARRFRMPPVPGVDYEEK